MQDPLNLGEMVTLFTIAIRDSVAYVGLEIVNQQALSLAGCSYRNLPLVDRLRQGGSVFQVYGKSASAVGLRRKFTVRPVRKRATQPEPCVGHPYLWQSRDLDLASS